VPKENNSHAVLHLGESQKSFIKVNKNL
jgi:hypothetical protein